MPIEEVEIGDLVLATDPETGETAPEKVTDLIVGEGLKELVRVGTDPDEDGEIDWVAATGGHPFWVDGMGWTKASDLDVGDGLTDEHGDVVTVRSLTEYRAEGAVYNLSVELIHTYFIVLDERAVLVHNASCPPPIRIPVTSARQAQKQMTAWVSSLKQQGYTCSTRGACRLGDFAHIDWWRGQRSGTIHFGPPYRPGRQ